MNEISTKVKKLNIFQKIRLNIFLRKQFFSMSKDEVIKLPDYIKNNDNFIHKVFEQKQELLEVINGSAILRCLNNEEIERYLKDYGTTLDKKLELVTIEPQYLNNVLSPDKLFYHAIENNNYEIFSSKGAVDFLRKNTNKFSDVVKLLQEQKADFAINEIFRNIDDNVLIPNEFIKLLPKEKQELRIKKDNNLIKYFDEDVQLEYIKKDVSKVQFASKLAQKNFANIDLEQNFRLTSEEFQIDVLKKAIGDEKFIDYFNLCSPSIKRDIVMYGQGEKIEILDELIKVAPEKYLQYTTDDYQKRAVKNNYKLYGFIKKGLKYGIKLTDTIDGEEFKRVFEEDKKKFFSIGTKGAKGTVLVDTITAHGDDIGVESKDWDNINVVKELSTKQLVDLIKIDSNYILTILGQYNPQRSGTPLDISDENGEIPEFKINKCKNIFKEMYGEEKLTQFSSIIDKTFELQTQYQKAQISYNTPDMKHQISKIPVQYLKILFNPQIMKSNSFEVINDYFDDIWKLQDETQKNIDLSKLNSNFEKDKIYEFRDTSIIKDFKKKHGDKFKRIIKNAYGDRAVEILEGRPELDVHEINSLEVFDERIIDNFSKAFVNDLITYNFENFSSFLNIVKDQESLGLFQNYYKILSSVMGNNAFSMQKAMQDFYHVEGLLKNIDTKELNDTQIESLLGVLCSDKNKYNINTIEQLDTYKKITSEFLRDDINNAILYGVYDPRDIILEDIFGSRISDIETYAITTKTLEKGIWSDDEKKMLETVLFLKKGEISDVVDFTRNNELSIMPISLFSALEKAKEKQLELYNDTFLTKEKMDEIISQIQREDMSEEEKSQLPIYKEVKNGNEYYHLNGIQFAMLYTDPGFGPESFSLQDYLTFEGQISNTAICCRYCNSEYELPSLKEGFLVYTNIEKDGLIVSNSNDARTSHDNKSMFMGGFGGIVDLSIANRPSANEVAIRRNYIEHEDRLNEGTGGRVVPDFIVSKSGNMNKNIEGKQIPMLVIHEEKYKEKEITKEHSNNMEDQKNECR